MTSHPQRRASDRLHVRVRENWYRDVWLLIISGAVLLALVSANDAINQIQQSRIAACQAQNLRHDRTLAQLDKELKQYARKASPARRAQLKASRGSTRQLINELVPHQNCTAVVHQTKPGH